MLHAGQFHADGVLARDRILNRTNSFVKKCCKGITGDAKRWKPSLHIRVV